MTDQVDKIILGKIVFDDNNQERKSWACLGQTCSRSLIVFRSQLFVILVIIQVAVGEFIFQKLVKNPLFGWEVCVVQQDTFTLTKAMKKLMSKKNAHHCIIGRSLQDGKVTIYLQLAPKWNLSTKN